MKRQLNGIAACLLATAVTAAAADDFPTKPIRLLIPFAPGGTTDVVARLVGPGLSKQLGQPVIIENRAGGGGVTGTHEMVRAAPDGYVLSLATASTTAANPAINPKTPYGPGDFTPIINIASTPTVIAVNPNFPAKDYASFIAEVKRNPGKYSFASSGMGGISHLQMESFKNMTGLFITHIPYRGAGPALTDTVGGQVQIVMDALPSAYPYIKSGQLRAIVVTAPARLKVLPDVPTFTEVGLAPLNRMSYFGVLGPKGMAPDLVKKLNTAFRVATEDPVVRQRIEDSGSVVVANTAEQFGAEIQREYVLLKKVVEESKLTLDGKAP
jgi:tripartite-type tricarboxylate transporter receptor subunit TctC